ncbi:hypothetical protein H0H87_005685 [Tephrocybe sp. NHM501043]|nr:hypothetical protein H0H87_005685 [Tephrocybe sp. NHM501043]
MKIVSDVFDANHDPSVLDVRRSMKYGLNKFVIEINQFAVIGSPAASSIFFKPTSSPIIAADEGRKDVELSVPATTEGRAPALRELEIMKVLGIGASAQVYMVKNRRTHAKQALKVVPYKELTFGRIFSVCEEQAILRKLAMHIGSEERKPYYPELVSTFHDSLNFYFLMSVYPTDVESEIIRCGKLSEERSRFYFAEAYLALSHLHALGIIHRDVKPSNLLLSPSGHLVLADFGLSRDFHLRPTFAERVFQPFWPYAREDLVGPNTPPRDGRDEKLKFTLFAKCGTGLFMAPELLRGEPYSFGVDFWALAVTLHIMLTGRPPFDGESDSFNEVAQMVLHGELEFRENDSLGAEAQELLFEMLEKRPEDRLRVTELEDHPFFAGMNWALMEKHEVCAPWVPDSEEPTFVLQEEPEKFAPGEAFNGLGTYPEFDWNAAEDDIFDEVDLTQPEPEVHKQKVLEAKEKLENAASVGTKSTSAKPFGFRAFFRRLWPWRRSQRSEEAPTIESNTTPTVFLSTSTLDLPPTPSCLSGASSSSSVPWVEYISHASVTMSSHLGSPTIPNASVSLPPSLQLLPVAPAPSDTCRPLLVQQVVNGTGALFKVKVWFKRLFPSPSSTLVTTFDLLT